MKKDQFFRVVVFPVAVREQLTARYIVLICTKRVSRWCIHWLWLAGGCRNMVRVPDRQELYPMDIKFTRLDADQ